MMNQAPIAMTAVSKPSMICALLEELLSASFSVPYEDPLPASYAADAFHLHETISQDVREPADKCGSKVESRETWNCQLHTLPTTLITYRF